MLIKIINFIIRYIHYCYRCVARPNVVKNEGVFLELGPHVSENIRKYIYNFAYEAAEVDTLRRVLCDDDVVLEIGGGIGFVSSFCAKKLGNKNVIIYEANPTLIECIKRNFRLNNISSQIHNKILSDRIGTQDFYVSEHFWSSSVIQRADDFKKITVETENINDIIKHNNINFIVMDIEGGEVDLIPKIADYSQIKKIMLELHTKIIGADKSMAVIRTLIDNGYVIDFDNSHSDVVFFKKI